MGDISFRYSKSPADGPPVVEKVAEEVGCGNTGSSQDDTREEGLDLGTSSSSSGSLDTAKDEGVVVATNSTTTSGTTTIDSSGSTSTSDSSSGDGGGDSGGGGDGGGDRVGCVLKCPLMAVEQYERYTGGVVHTFASSSLAAAALTGVSRIRVSLSCIGESVSQ
jgi:hypothetical protein